eukprot:2125602-Rhodomonas_salina.3
MLSMLREVRVHVQIESRGLTLIRMRSWCSIEETAQLEEEADKMAEALAQTTQHVMSNLEAKLSLSYPNESDGKLTAFFSSPRAQHPCFKRDGHKTRP